MIKSLAKISDFKMIIGNLSRILDKDPNKKWLINNFLILLINYRFIISINLNYIEIINVLNSVRSISPHSICSHPSSCH